MKQLSIVIPFHNEEGNIETVLKSFLPFVGRYDFEVICVDDASADRSAEFFKRFLLMSEYNFIKFITISREAHRGYGHAIMSGVREARGEVISWTHSDMQADPADAFRAFDEYKKYNNPKIIIKGRRIGRNISDVIFSFGMASIASIVLQKLFFEINAQPKLFHRSAFSLLAGAPDDFSLDLYFLYQAKQSGYEIRNIPVKFAARTFGESKWAFSFSAKLKTILRTVRYIFKLRRTI